VGPLSTKSTAAGRASLAVYVFNINQMRLQWRGWIEHIRGSGLPAPDLILLQDVDSDKSAQEAASSSRERLRRSISKGRGASRPGRAPSCGAGPFRASAAQSMEGLGTSSRQTGLHRAGRGGAGGAGPATS
jgi:hypothetical protein